MRAVLPNFRRYSRAFSLAAVLGFFVAAIFLSSQNARAQADDKTQQAVTFFNEGQDAHEKGDLESALKLYARAIELIPEFPEAELQKGNAYLALNKSADAEKAYRRALELREDWSLAMASLGSVLVSQRQFPEAEKLLTKTLENEEMNLLALTALVELRLHTNANEAALRNLSAKIDALSGKVRPSAALLGAKAAIDQRLGNRAVAKESASRALLLDPKLKIAIVITADIALLENDLENAEGLIRRLEALVPKAEETIALRARIFFAQGKKADALAALESIPLPSYSSKEMIAKIKEGDIADLAGLETKIQRTPDDVNALMKLCTGFRLSDPAKALEYCRRASIAEPNEISHAVGFGAALVQAKRYDEAVALFRKLLTIAPEHATIRANLATALFQLKRYPEAKTEFRWLTEKQPESAAAFYFLGITHDQLGEFLDAMANYQQFLKLADTEANKIEIEKVNLRLPLIQKQIKNGKGKKSE
jgi:tetratricopeptide (TPR) repeat protein